MVKDTIRIFLRLKPTKAKKGQYEILEDGSLASQVSITVPRDVGDGVVNNRKETHKFKFQQIFDVQSKQEEIFDVVARPVIDTVLQGYNGTIFAYGQTGSGKTFTITGGAERYADRGIIPRTLSYIFNHYAKNKDCQFTTVVSYLEIYNETGYDLLDPKHETSKLDDLPKVTLMEDSEQNIHLKNLSTHQAHGEEEALNLLFLGDTNRMIAETPMNQASTRSHCIFTVHVTSHVVGSATVRRSKLHLVDLAGSERVSKTGVNGVLLTEAKYINLSLHYLEQVIVALSERSRQHIPYRNSMMTSVLRDSLGGNCMTTMIATCSVERTNIDETISTCRFAQRVAVIKNEAILNEELDPQLMIVRLRREIEELKGELVLVRGGGGDEREGELTREQLQECEQAVERFIEDEDEESRLRVKTDMRLIHLCFQIMKRTIQECKKHLAGLETESQAERNNLMVTRGESTSVHNSKESSQLKEIIQQRDNEINILVNMLKKEKQRANDAVSSTGGGKIEGMGDSSGAGGRSQFNFAGGSASSDRMSVSSEHDREERDKRTARTRTKILGEMSLGRQEAFELFCRDHSDSDEITANKSTLRQSYAEAKQLGQIVNESRTNINKLKTLIEQHRVSRAMRGYDDVGGRDSQGTGALNREPDEEELDLRRHIEDEQLRYRDSFNRLRELKTKIEHLQYLLEKSKLQLMKDFELWWQEQTIQAQRRGVQTTDVSMDRTSSSSPHYNDRPVTRSSGSNGTSHASNRPTDRLQDNSSVRGHNNSATSSMRLRAEGVDIPLTGDPQADSDIQAFLQARQSLMRAKVQGQR